jgi:hypothetical protein
MRLPLAPTYPPPQDSVPSSSGLHILRMLGGYRTPSAQVAANSVAVAKEYKDPSMLLENMVAGFAQRCDHLMADVSYANEAPAFFTPMWMVSCYEAGIRNEQWMGAWSHMRNSERKR